MCNMLFTLGGGLMTTTYSSRQAKRILRKALAAQHKSCRAEAKRLSAQAIIDLAKEAEIDPKYLRWPTKPDWDFIRFMSFMLVATGFLVAVILWSSK